MCVNRGMLFQAMGLGLGFLANRAGLSLMTRKEPVPMLIEEEPEKLYEQMADRLALLYQAEAFDILIKDSDELHFQASGILADIQAAAHAEARMPNEMAGRAIVTLRALAQDKEVSDADIEHTLLLLEFVDKGSEVYVAKLQRNASL